MLATLLIVIIAIILIVIIAIPGKAPRSEVPTVKGKTRYTREVRKPLRRPGIGEPRTL